MPKVLDAVPCISLDVLHIPAALQREGDTKALGGTEECLHPATHLELWLTYLFFPEVWSNSYHLAPESSQDIAMLR